MREKISKTYSKNNSLWLLIYIIQLFISACTQQEEKKLNSETDKINKEVYIKIIGIELEYYNKTKDINCKQKVDSVMEKYQLYGKPEDSILATAFSIKAKIYEDKNLLDSAWENINRSVYYCTDTTFSTFPLILLKKGDIAFKKGLIDVGYVYYLKGASSIQVNAKSDIKITTSNSLGLAVYRNHQFSLSRLFFMKALRSYSNIDTTFSLTYRKQEIYGNIALSYISENKLDSSKMYFDSALYQINNHWKISANKNSNDSLSLEVAKSVIYSNIGYYYKLQNNLDKALEYFLLSYYISEKSNRELTSAFLNLKQINLIYANKKDTKKLLYYTRKQDSIFIASKDDGFEVISANTDFLNYYNLGWKDSAFNVLFRKYNYFINFISKQNASVFKTVDEQLSILEKNKSLLFAQKESNAKEKLLNIYYYIIIGVALFIIILLIILYRMRFLLKNNTSLISDIENKNLLLQKNEFELEKTNKLLSQFIDEKNEVLGFVAHDMRTPISGIEGLANLMLIKAVEPEEYDMILQKIIELCSDTTVLIQDVIEAVRLEELNEIETYPLDANQVVKKSIQFTENYAQQKNISLKMDSISAKILIQGNEDKLIRAITNLITNAIKFSHRGEEVLVSISNKDNFIAISVIDKGIGMSDKIKNNLFKRFTEVGRAGTEGEKSIGLGTSLIKKIIDLHHGKIEVDSIEGKGTNITLLLPSK